VLLNGSVCVLRGAGLITHPHLVYGITYPHFVCLRCPMA